MFWIGTARCWGSNVVNSQTGFPLLCLQSSQYAKKESLPPLQNNKSGIWWLIAGRVWYCFECWALGYKIAGFESIFLLFLLIETFACPYGQWRHPLPQHIPRFLRWYSVMTQRPVVGSQYISCAFSQASLCACSISPSLMEQILNAWLWCFLGSRLSTANSMHLPPGRQPNPHLAMAAQVEQNPRGIPKAPFVVSDACSYWTAGVHWKSSQTIIIIAGKC